MWFFDCSCGAECKYATFKFIEFSGPVNFPVIARPGSAGLGYQSYPTDPAKRFSLHLPTPSFGSQGNLQEE